MLLGKGSRFFSGDTQSVGQVLDDWKVIVAALICQCHLPEQIVHDARKNCHKVSSH